MFSTCNSLEHDLLRTSTTPNFSGALKHPQPWLLLCHLISFESGAWPKILH
jgi:hypothetical protein